MSKKVTRKELCDYFKNLCAFSNKKLTRSEYRKLNTPISSTAIEKLFGSWSEFTSEAKTGILRDNKTITFTEKDKKVVISYIPDGAGLDFTAFNILQNYCAVNNCKLGILWGKSVTKQSFAPLVYEWLKDYLATEFEFKLDPLCIAKDYLIPVTQKNPLLNIDKLTTHLDTVIVGASKQYLKILPYKQYEPFRVGCSTGTIGILPYKENVSGNLDKKYNTLGGIVLEYDDTLKRYVPRNLIIKNNALYDLNKVYTEDSCKDVEGTDAIILGDLHLPDEDVQAVIKTEEQISSLKPKYALIHDVASWNSISHHDLHNYLDRVRNKTPGASTLEAELTQVVSKLTQLANRHKDVEFKIVKSNHDSFIEKWLNTGEFVKDPYNAEIGSKLYVECLHNKNILDDYLMSNVELLKANSSFRVNNFELGEHGDSGISGCKGSVRQFTKSFEKIIYGHRHSPEITESAVVVGTLSKLKLCYNQQGMTDWAHANAIIHKNGTFQLIIF